MSRPLRIRFTAHAKQQMTARNIPEWAVRKAIRYARAWPAHRHELAGGYEEATPPFDPTGRTHFITKDLGLSKPKLRRWVGVVVHTVEDANRPGTRVVITAYFNITNHIDLKPRRSEDDRPSREAS